MEIIVSVAGIVLAILLWFFPPEPVRKFLGLREYKPDSKRQVKTPMPSFTGIVYEDKYRSERKNGAPGFMNFIQNNIGKTVYFDLEVGKDQMDTLNKFTFEGNAKAYVLAVEHPTLNYWYELKMIVEPSDDFFYGPISVEYGQLRGHFRIKGWHEIGTGVTGFELKAVPIVE